MPPPEPGGSPASPPEQIGGGDQGTQSWPGWHGPRSLTHAWPPASILSGQKVLTRTPHVSMLTHLRHAAGAALLLAVLPATLAFAPAGVPSLRFSGAFLTQPRVTDFNRCARIPALGETGELCLV